MVRHWVEDPEQLGVDVRILLARIRVRRVHVAGDAVVDHLLVQGLPRQRRDRVRELLADNALERCHLTRFVQTAEQIVERPILEHQHNDMVDRGARVVSGHHRVLPRTNEQSAQINRPRRYRRSQPISSAQNCRSVAALGFTEVDRPAPLPGRAASRTGVSDAGPGVRPYGLTSFRNLVRNWESVLLALVAGAGGGAMDPVFEIDGSQVDGHARVRFVGELDMAAVGQAL